MNSHTMTNRYSRELENMERMLTRITQDLEQELREADKNQYRPLHQQTTIKTPPKIQLTN